VEGHPYGRAGQYYKGINADSAKKVLQKMQQMHIENLPIVKNSRFSFFVNCGEILSSLISTYILDLSGQKQGSHPG